MLVHSPGTASVMMMKGRVHLREEPNGFQDIHTHTERPGNWSAIQTIRPFRLKWYEKHKREPMSRTGEKKKRPGEAGARGLRRSEGAERGPSRGRERQEEAGAGQRRRRRRNWTVIEGNSTPSAQGQGSSTC